MDLINVWHVNDRVQPFKTHGGFRFFESLPGGSLFGGFRVFHKTGRQGPVPVSGFDRAPAQEDLAFPDRYRPGNNAGVLVMYGLTARAHIPRAIVTGRYALFDRVTAATAEFHE